MVCACVALALCGCGSSSDEQPTSTQAPTEAPATPQDQAAGTVCAARADIQAEVQADLTPERKQQVQEAVTSFGTQLRTIAREAVAGLATGDAKTQASNAAESLKTAVTESLQPIDC